MTFSIKVDQISKRYRMGKALLGLGELLNGWRNSGPGDFHWAVKDVSFQLQPGESLALVGSNGAGKTTILKLLSKVTQPTSGHINMNGRFSALIELGAGFHPDLSGRENIYLNGSILGLSHRDITRRFDEIVAFSELERFIDTPVKRYSSGMIVRLGFAVASCVEPDILLVDEVLAVGDAAFQQKCLKRIRALINKGTTIIFVSHNFYLIQAVCNTALYLKKGQIKYSGTPKDVIDLYEQDLHQERARKFEDVSLLGQGAVDEREEVEITKVEVLNPTEPNLDFLPNHQPAQINIYYNAYKPLGKVQASVFIIRSDGLTCCMMRTKLADFDLRVQQGQGVISVHMQPLQLVSGTYYAEAWFLDEQDSMALTPKGGRSSWFSVKGAALSYEESSGIFEPITSWNHSQNGTHAD